ncbi:Phosphoribosylformylglycinamidine cyclo-ligase [Planctomycetales bacterium 10988]|nr:Phosphoribosylformylglycinamidine cyclo-ligase [Planctomycetales bacterium 10988]
MKKATYKQSGVDLEVYQEAMGRIGRHLRRTHSPRVMPLEGGFAGLFRLDFNSPLFARNYQDPVLVSCTDGVGTKLKVAALTGIHRTVGIDLVAMCINDALCCGAEPLFFLDYLALPKDNPELIEDLVAGISQGCLESDCALLGGETAILPGVYQAEDYDMAGFCVGVVERKRLIDGKNIAPGDQVIGLASSGFHSNGYSLIRQAVFEMARLSVDQEVPELGQTVGEILMTPTRIYAQPLRRIFHHYQVKNVIHGIAHITGGGLAENIERILPDNIQLTLDKASWTIPPVFDWIQQCGNIDQDEMEKVFNCGIGLVMIVSPYYAESIRQQLTEMGVENWLLGEAEEGPRGVQWKDA